MGGFPVLTAPRFIFDFFCPLLEDLIETGTCQFFNHGYYEFLGCDKDTLDWGSLLLRSHELLDLFGGDGEDLGDCQFRCSVNFVVHLVFIHVRVDLDWIKFTLICHLDQV